MRVLFTTLPGAGPFHPLVPLAQTLQAAGHEVAFACSRSYCPTVEATGLRCFPAGFLPAQMISDLLSLARSAGAHDDAQRPG